MAEHFGEPQHLGEAAPVRFQATKAKVSAITLFIGGVLVLVTQTFQNDAVQVWGGLAVGIVTLFTNVFAVYQTENKPIEQ